MSKHLMSFLIAFLFLSFSTVVVSAQSLTSQESLPTINAINGAIEPVRTSRIQNLAQSEPHLQVVPDLQMENYQALDRGTLLQPLVMAGDDDDDDEHFHYWVPNSYHVYSSDSEQFYTSFLNYRGRFLLDPDYHNPLKYQERRYEYTQALSQDIPRALENEVLARQIEDEAKMRAMKFISDGNAIFVPEQNLVYYNSGLSDELVRAMAHDEHPLPSLYFDRHEGVYCFDYYYVD